MCDFNYGKDAASADTHGAFHSLAESHLQKYGGKKVPNPLPRTGTSIHARLCLTLLPLAQGPTDATKHLTQSTLGGSKGTASVAPRCSPTESDDTGGAIAAIMGAPLAPVPVSAPPQPSSGNVDTVDYMAQYCPCWGACECTAQGKLNKTSGVPVKNATMPLGSTLQARTTLSRLRADHSFCRSFATPSTRLPRVKVMAPLSRKVPSFAPRIDSTMLCARSSL